MFPLVKETGMYALAEFEILPYFHRGIVQLDERLIKVETYEERIARLEEEVADLKQQLKNVA